MKEIIIKDEALSGELLNQIIIGIEQDIITVKELIQLRVEEEVKKYNDSLNGHFNGFVQPTISEKVLNGYALKKGRKIDAEKQFYIALEAFKQNGFFILVNDKQVSGLEEELLLDRETEVNFVKLTPLVGG